MGCGRLIPAGPLGAEPEVHRLRLRTRHPPGQAKGASKPAARSLGCAGHVALSPRPGRSRCRDGGHPCGGNPLVGAGWG